MNGRKYVKFSYVLDIPHCNFDELNLIPVENDEFFNEIKFEGNIATLYFKENFVLQGTQSKAQLKKYAEKKLFSIFLEMIKSSRAQKFEISTEESHIDDAKEVFVKIEESIKISCSANVEVHRADGSIVTEEENRQSLIECNKNKMRQIILNSCANMVIQEQDYQRLIRLLKTEDSIIKYLILYSWLSELLLKDGNERQEEVNKYIMKSDTYSTIPDSFKKPPVRNGRDDQTYFTYLRNLIGHTVGDALAFDDKTIIKKVETCTSWLFQILLEKLLRRS